MKRWTVLFLLMGLGLAAPSLTAQTVEITPYAGFMFGGTFEDHYNDEFDDVDVQEGESFGLLLGVGLSPGWKLELMYNRQETETELSRRIGGGVFDTTIEYFHVGGSYEWRPGQAHPFLAGSIGGTRFDIEADSDTRFSWTFGGGVKAFVTDNLGFRIESRLYGSFVEENEEIVCNPNVCVRYRDATVFVQIDLKAGLIIAF